MFARMDSNGAGEEMYRAHPDWFTRNAAGQPVLRATVVAHAVHQRPVLSRAHPGHPPRDRDPGIKPEGFTDNSWSGLSRASICFCDNCRAKFRKERGFDLPAAR